MEFEEGEVVFDVERDWWANWIKSDDSELPNLLPICLICFNLSSIFEVNSFLFVRRVELNFLFLKRISERMEKR